MTMPSIRLPDEPLMLSFDTSTPQSTVALSRGGVCLAEINQGFRRTHSSELLPALERVLAMSGFTPKDLGAVAVGLGPGSFTGVRIGVATAKSFAHSLGIPLVGMSTLELVAANAWGSERLLCPLLNAGKGEVCWTLYHWTGAGLQEVQPYRISPPSAVGPFQAGSVWLLGEAGHRHREALLQAAGSEAGWLPEVFWHPRAAVLGMLGSQRLKAGRTVDPLALLPIYGKPPDLKEPG